MYVVLRSFQLHSFFVLTACIFLAGYCTSQASARSASDIDSPLVGIETVNTQAVSPSGYRYDTAQGNPYGSGALSNSGILSSNVPRTPSTRTTTYLPVGSGRNRVLSPFVKSYAPNPSWQTSPGSSQFSASNNPYGVPSGCLPSPYTPGSGSSYGNSSYANNPYGSAYGPPATTAPFPQYTGPTGMEPFRMHVGHNYSALPYTASTMAYKPPFKRLSPAELHEKIIWSAASCEDEAMLARIQKEQLSYGPQDTTTIREMWEAASYFADEQKQNLAEPLLKELIVSIESHPEQMANNASIYSLAKAKLADLQSMDNRVASTPVIDPSTVYVAKPYTPMSYASAYGYGSYGGGGGGWGHYHNYSSHYHSVHFHSGGHSGGGGHAHVR